MSKPAESLRVLLTDLIDYAGLFPPAGLDMKSAVANYSRYLRDDYAWMLGRFVVPASRLNEFEQAMPENEPQPWRLSVLLGSKLEDDNIAVREFGPRCSKLAVIDCVETKVTSVEEVDRVHRMIGSAATTYYETPLTAELPALLAAIKRVNGRAKIRTGGVTTDSFPAGDAVAHFLVECSQRKLAFKATAGLHHPVRCLRPLTYAPDAPTGAMHGFLNLFLVAASSYGGTDKEQFELFVALLDSSHPELHFGERVASIGSKIDNISQGERKTDVTIHRYGQTEIPLEQLQLARQNFAISFGSCSFEEPIADLKALNLL